MHLTALDHILTMYDGAPDGPVPTETHWLTAESAIKRSIPQDFKAIVEKTGGCRMGCCFVRNPAESEDIGLKHVALAREYAAWGARAENRLRLPMYPEADGWVQIAVVDHTFFMLKASGDDIAIVDFDLCEITEPGLTYSALIWKIFRDRDAFDGLGASIWAEESPLFGPRRVRYD